VSGDLPGGAEFDARVMTDMIVVRVGDRLCVAHAHWLSIPDADRMAKAIIDVGIAYRSAVARDAN
jgi:hypothetical protein